MKKFFALLLALTVTLAFVACGETGTDGDNNVSGIQSGTVASDASDSDSAVSSDTASQDTEAQTPAFDTSWAENDLQKLIPQPPFSGWKILSASDTECEMECATGVTDTAVFYPTCEDYVETLNNAGFTETEKSKQYLYEATDAAGNTVEFKYGDTYCWITITAAPAK